jgi:hypothetical protein
MAERSASKKAVRRFLRGGVRDTRYGHKKRADARKAAKAAGTKAAAAPSKAGGGGSSGQ